MLHWTMRRAYLCTFSRAPRWTVASFLYDFLLLQERAPHEVSFRSGKGKVEKRHYASSVAGLGFVGLGKIGSGMVTNLSKAARDPSGCGSSS